MTPGEIERIKLNATFLNNAAVGVFVGGLFVPYAAILQHAVDIIDRVMKPASISQKDLMNAIAYLSALGMAYWTSKEFRRMAKRAVKQLDRDPVDGTESAVTSSLQDRESPAPSSPGAVRSNGT